MQATQGPEFGWLARRFVELDAEQGDPDTRRVVCVCVGVEGEGGRTRHILLLVGKLLAGAEAAAFA